MAGRRADWSVCLGPAPSRDRLLSKAALLTAASSADADAVHPGRGFLSENAGFATMGEEHGFTVIGPTPEHIALMGDKITAKRTAKAAGVPVVPGTDGPVQTDEEAKRLAHEIGFPVLIKAAGGGGGKGMQLAQGPEELDRELGRASGREGVGQ